MFRWALANVSVAFPQKPLGVLVVNWEPVALNKFVIRLAFQPTQVFSDAVVELQNWLFHFRVRVLEAQKEFALVQARVLVA
jgi:hypothetical protein